MADTHPTNDAGQSDASGAAPLSAWDILMRRGYDRLLVAQFKQVFPNVSEEQEFLRDLEAFVALKAATTGNVGLPGPYVASFHYALLAILVSFSRRRTWRPASPGPTQKRP